MPMTLLLLVCFAALFYRAADYERMSPFTWGLASIGVTLGVSYGMRGGLGMIIMGQVALFGVMTWYNAKRKR